MLHSRMICLNCIRHQHNAADPSGRLSANWIRSSWAAAQNAKANLCRFNPPSSRSLHFRQQHCSPLLQVFFAGLIFVLLSSQDGFSRDWKAGHAPALYNGVFSTVSFLLGATTSIVSGFLGMKIAVYANARTALEARKGIAPAFMCGECRCWALLHRCVSQSRSISGDCWHRQWSFWSVVWSVRLLGNTAPLCRLL